jgi:hypothetical protein
MKKVIPHIILSLSLLMLAYKYVQAQAAFQTIVTKGPVEAGESFQVQYVLEDTEEDSEFFAPDFKGFRFVSGPNIYTGSALGASGHKKLKNIVFTLAAMGPGKFVIPGASARVGNRLIKSRNVLLEVISQSEAYARRPKSNIPETNEDKFLSPGEDPYTKIQRNLFMKVLVDKRICFVGEPVTATFKLYSRLDSKSDIVKNPGFYGFTVQDMINLDNKLSGIETINGKKFDVHTVRKVQLYPLQAGIFNIDAMEVHNKVRFSKSAVNKKAEQEIAEGVFPDNGKVIDNSTTGFENDMATEPLAITVKPAPVKNKPVDYNGATGSFIITSSLVKNELAKNEEGEFVIAINGKGNFVQLSAPVIKWPAGIEGFEPTIKDFLDHTHSPMNGKREFRFRFVSVKAGNYVLPAVGFSFFNPDSNNYKIVISQALNVSVSSTEKSAVVITTENKKAASRNDQWKWWMGGGIILLAIAGLVVWFRKNKKAISPEPSTEKLSSTVAIADILQAANTFCEADDRTFYNVLRNCIWNFFTQHFGLTGSKMNKTSLAEAMQKENVDEKSQKKILEILDQCQTGVFTNTEGTGDKKKLLEEVKDVLVKISTQLH